MDGVRIGLALALLAALFGAAWLYAENGRLRAELAVRSAATRAPAGARAGGTPPPAERGLSAAARAGLVSQLAQVLDPERKVWFLTDPGSSEAAEFRAELSAIFAEAGWPVQNAVSRSRLKPGLLALVAADEPPAFVSDALSALEQAGLEITTGTGYTAYYEQRRAEEPDWNGLRMAADQSWVLVVGRQESPAP